MALHAPDKEGRDLLEPAGRADPEVDMPRR